MLMLRRVANALSSAAKLDKDTPNGMYVFLELIDLFDLVSDFIFVASLSPTEETRFFAPALVFLYLSLGCVYLKVEDMVLYDEKDDGTLWRVCVHYMTTFLLWSNKCLLL